MLPTIQRSKIFQEEYNRFKSAIDKMPEGELKGRCQNMLNKLVSEVALLDSLHDNISQRKELQSSGSEVRDRIADLRRKLDRTVTDWSKTN